MFPAWATEPWIGGKDEGSGYQWKGLITDDVPGNGEDEADWFGDRPDGGSRCMRMSTSRGWFDFGCTTADRYFICETP